MGSDDLFAQLLDKLIANAVGFGDFDKPIEIALRGVHEDIVLDVINRGSELPHAMQKQIFNSMVSLRGDRSGDEPHLGLGLFIARLIAELHRGGITARNLDDGSGACFTVTLPRLA
jgi:signal transduction histidine kinase